MRRTDLLALVLPVACFGCGGDESATDAKPAPRHDTTIQAEAAPATDFREYMLGDLPGPGTLARDPFDGVGDAEPVAAPVRPAAPHVVPAPALRGIVRSKDRFVALFDQGSAGLGESVRGWTVASIDERSVTLQRNGRTVRRAL